MFSQVHVDGQDMENGPEEKGLSQMKGRLQNGRNQWAAQTGNRTEDPLVHRLTLNPLSHTSQGWNRNLKEEPQAKKGVVVQIKEPVPRPTILGAGRDNLKPVCTASVPSTSGHISSCS